MDLYKCHRPMALHGSLLDEMPASLAGSKSVMSLLPLLLPFLSLSLLRHASAQTISTNMPLPPMEWIKLNPSGASSPPPIAHGCLAGPTIAASSSSPGAGQAFLFGGRSGAGTASDSLYILNYQSDPPVWSQPSVTTSTIFTSTPTARSHMLCAWDTSGNYRNQLSIYGGRASDGTPLGDFWVFDQANSFWAQPNQAKPSPPPALYGAVGGMDPTFVPASPATASAFLFAGGSNATANNPLTPFGMVVDGQLGSNTDTITLTVSSLASGIEGNPAAHNLVSGRWGTSSTIMPGSKLVLFSGCNTPPTDEFSSSPSPTCALSNGGVLSMASNTSPATLTSATKSTWQSFDYCPPPRIGGTMVPNRNTFDSSFAQQVILIGGQVNHVDWNDQGGSSQGEVDVLDTSSGVWSRVVPSHRSGENFSMKTGINALALSGSVGSTSSNGTTDILVYGGIDVASGQASNELWILRLHPAKMTGNGTASGVTMTYLPSCAAPTPKNVNNSTSNSDSLSTNPGSSSSVSISDLTVSKEHEFLTAIPFAVLLICVTALRYEEPGLLSFSRMWRMPRLWALLTAWTGLFASIIVFLLGIVAGLTQTRSNSRTAISTSSTTRHRRSLFTDDSPAHLSISLTLARSTHARLGLALAVAGFILVPTLYLASWLYGRREAKRRARKLKYGERRTLKAKVVARSAWNPAYWENWLMRGMSGRRNRSRPQQRFSSTDKQPASPLGLSRVTMFPEKSTGPPAEERVLQSKELASETREHEANIEDPKHERIESSSTTKTRINQAHHHSSPQDGELQRSITGNGGEAGGQSPAEELDGGTSENETPLVPDESRARLNVPIVGTKPSETGRPGVLRAFHNFSNTFLGLKNSSTRPGLEVRPGLTQGSNSFEVLNRRSPLSRSLLSGPPKPALHRRRSLDLSVELDRNRARANEHFPADATVLKTPDKALSLEQVHGLEVGEGDEEEDEREEDDDDSMHQRVAPRTKLRRLADVLFHTVLFLGNLFLIVSFFTGSKTRLRYIGGLYLALCLASYALMGWLAWKGRPSAESTMVIFMSILRNGRTGGADTPNATQQAMPGGAQSQFISYAQSSPQQPQHPSPGAELRPQSFTSTVLYHPLHAPVHNFGTTAAALGSDAGESSEFGPSAGGFWPDHHAGSVEGCGVEEDAREAIELGEDYWREREVQIVTTAPRRRLAVVNG